MKSHPLNSVPLVCAALVLGVLGVAAPDAGAHNLFPEGTILKSAERADNGNLRVTIEYEIPASHDGTNPFIDFGVSTVGANWCKAKDTLPAGWRTQKKRELRTSSMCKENPKYGSLGEDISNDGSAGTKTWQTPENFNFTDGAWIFSINFWTGTTVHHEDGNHTKLWMQRIENGKPRDFTE